MLMRFDGTACETVRSRTAYGPRLLFRSNHGKVLSHFLYGLLRSYSVLHSCLSSSPICFSFRSGKSTPLINDHMPHAHTFTMTVDSGHRSTLIFSPECVHGMSSKKQSKHFINSHAQLRVVILMTPVRLSKMFGKGKETRYNRMFCPIKAFATGVVFCCMS